jgi:hypothetical protein
MNQTKSVDKFYLTFDKSIALTSAYLEDPSIDFIIRSCRMKPYDIIYKEYNKKIKFHSKWVDENGNTLEIIKKKVSISNNNINLDKSLLVKTDIYENLPIYKIAKISKFAFFIFGKDEDLLEDHTIMTFLGLDGFFRSYCLLFGQWTKIPTTYLGLNFLKLIFQNLDLKRFVEVKLKNKPYPCKRSRGFLSSMPACPEMVRLIRDISEPTFDILKLGV